MTTTATGRGVLCRVPMRWGDMDPYGHVNNVEVVRLLEEARVVALGIPVGTGHQVEPPLIPFFSALPEGTQALITEPPRSRSSSLPSRQSARNVRRASGSGLRSVARV